MSKEELVELLDEETGGDCSISTLRAITEVLSDKKLLRLEEENEQQ